MRPLRFAPAALLGCATCALASTASAQQPPPAPVPQVVIIPADPAAQPAAVDVLPVAPVTQQQPPAPPAPVSPAATIPPPTVVLQQQVYPPYPYPIYVITLPPPPAPAPPPQVPPPARRPPPVAPPPPPPATGVHMHDGFYLRMGLGAGGLAAVTGKDTAAESKWTTGGGALEFGMGGSLGDGFIIGGRVIGISGSSVQEQTKGDTSDLPGSLSLTSVQVFADWYLSPDSGFHLQAGLGPSGLEYDPSGGRSSKSKGDTSSLDGFGGALGVGWEGWVGDEWSIGGMLNLQFASFDGVLDPGTDSGTPSLVESDQDKIHVVAPMLLFTATYN